jgi:hypothetical protein
LLGAGTIKYLIIGAILLAFGSNILSSITYIVQQAKQGSYAPIVIILITAPIAIKFMGSKSKGLNQGSTQVAYWLVYAFATAYTSLVIGLTLFSTTLQLYLGVAGFGITAIACKALFDSENDGLSLKQRMSFLISSTKATMNSTAVGQWSGGNGIAWNLSGQSKVFIVPPVSFQSVLDLMKERPNLPISLTHLPETDCLVVPSTNGWQRKVQNLLTERGIPTLSRASTLFEIAVLSLPLIVESRLQSPQEYGWTQDEKVVQKLVNQLPAGLTLFPNTNGLKAITPMDGAPGYELESLSRVNSLRLLINRDDRAFPQGGTEVVTIT